MIAPSRSILRDESYMRTGGIHELGKILHFMGGAKVPALALAVPSNEFHGSRS
jgi:hypothetical protein